MRPELVPLLPVSLMITYRKLVCRIPTTHGGFQEQKRSQYVFWLTPVSSASGDDPSLKQAAKSVNASVLPQFVTFIKTQQRLLKKMKDIGADAKVHILHSILAGTPCKLAKMSICTFLQPRILHGTLPTSAKIRISLTASDLHLAIRIIGHRFPQRNFKCLRPSLFCHNRSYLITRSQ